MRILLIMALSLCVTLASANDGSTPYIDVLGVNSHGNTTESKIEIYGNEMKMFFDVLPMDFVFAEESRSIQFYSKSWVGSIWCSNKYRRPTNGELRDDHMCTFQIFEPWGHPNDDDFGGDNYVVVSENLGKMQKYDLNVLGINPLGVKKGKVYSFYGKMAENVAKPVIENGGGQITFTSKAYKVTLACQEEYQRPVGKKEMRNDYMCSLSLD